MWDEIDEKLGFEKYSEGPTRTGWLVNMVQVSSGILEAGVLCADCRTNLDSDRCT